MQHATRLVSLVSLVALLAPIALTGCSRITTSEVAQRELGAIALGSGLRVTVRAAHQRTRTSAGLTGAGRGFTYQDAMESHQLELSLGATLTGGKTLERALGSRACSSADDCKAQLASASATLCESQGEAIAIVGKHRWALFTYGGELFDASVKDDATACEATARQLPPVIDRLAAAGRGCGALLAAKESRATTRCMLRLGSTNSFAAESVASRIEAAIAGAEDEDLQIRWVAAIGRGAKEAPDFERALYEQLLLPNDQASSAAARLALAYAPSRARRVQFLTQALAGCRDHTLPPFGRVVAGIAAALLADPTVTERIARACEVPTPAPEPWHPSHLK